ncbi:copper chaperone PCu(A)C [Hyphomicrobium sp. CS1BSMeth3]|uniref:copper chaperone PCu(A)C n=1 Tax=Hyphomicrobium sp. CS1BSMeth3 TaxID=1892844 RepID=UPI000930352B|nr:copper chaperone PCu(A)C [Hyphomicrobium sp. CS1BSMeth3]
MSSRIVLLTVFSVVLRQIGKLRASSALCAAAAALILLAMLPAQAHDFKAGSLHLDHPWARPTPAGAKVGAGYVSIRNTGKVADRLVAASTDVAGKTEIHEVAVDAQGVMRMRALAKGLPIPAGATVALKPSAYHLMFMDLKRPLKVGDTFSGVLAFERGGKVKVEFVVEATSSAGPAHGSKH